MYFNFILYFIVIVQIHSIPVHTVCMVTLMTLSGMMLLIISNRISDVLSRVMFALLSGGSNPSPLPGLKKQEHSYFIDAYCMR